MNALNSQISEFVNFRKGFAFEKNFNSDGFAFFITNPRFSLSMLISLDSNVFACWYYQNGHIDKVSYTTNHDTIGFYLDYLNDTFNIAAINIYCMDIFSLRIKN